MWDGASWNNVLTGLMCLEIFGSEDNNLFAVGYSGVNDFSGEVYHYNGADWFHFENLQFQYVRYFDIWTDGTEAFIVGTTWYYPQKTLILHGK